MTIDFSATPDNGPTSTESEGSMFAPIPSWERGKKRRGLSRAFGGGRTSSVAEEPRSFTAEPDRSLETGVLAGDQRAYAFDPIAPTGTAEAEPAFAGTPSYANVTARRKSNAAPVAIAAGIVLLGGLAATGWYMTQNHTVGVAQLTPGAVTTTTTTAPAGDEVQTAANSTPQAALPAAAAPTAAAPAATTHVTTTTTTHSAAPASVTHKTTTTVARARPAPSASEAGANASATLPAAPQPYQGSATAPTPAPAAPAAPLVLSIPAAPAQAAPVQTAPAPTQTAPATTTPPTETPPQ